jgi:predicted nucleic acid-binding protein
MDAEIRVRQFVDTNILMYAHDATAGRKHEVAKAMLLELWETHGGCLSIQVLQEFYVNVTQKIPVPLNRSKARQILTKLSQWIVHSPGVNDVLSAIDLQSEYAISFWDAMIVQSALRTGCTQIWSEDLSHGGVYGTVRVVNPFVE